MVFFAFSFLASIFGGLSASRSYDFSYNIALAINGPLAKIIAFWPFIVALVLLLLAILWYQNIKILQRRKKKGGARSSQGLQGMVLMGIVTVFVIVLLAAPYFLEQFNVTTQNEAEIAADNRIEMVLTVHGMDCGGCEALIQKKVGELDGVESVAASHTREEVFVVYDKSKLSPNTIAQAIEGAGYTVVLE